MKARSEPLAFCRIALAFAWRIPSVPIRTSIHKSFRGVRKFSGARFFFLAPRRRSGERTEERGVVIGRSSSPRPSPPSDGGEGASWVAALPRRGHPWLLFLRPSAPALLRHSGA